ncbi:MAG: DNA-binding response regulator [Bacteroidetes bacterium]|nr:MAG: DNA-binding response regulator [Bacteroidota bacterium]
MISFRNHHANRRFWGFREKFNFVPKMRKIRTLVIDDEPLARARILKLLQSVEYITVIGECKNGKEARRQIENYQPDLIFLDIQMPDLNGFEVLQDADLTHRPFIIFVTAFDHYALKAFDVRAVDYLLKPYDDDRFFKALNHARQQILLKDQATLHQKIVKVIEAYEHQHSDNLSALEIRDKGRTFLVNIQDVYWIEAEGNYLKIHLENQKHLIRMTLQSIENQLDRNFFFRIHRSVLVHKLYIESVAYKGNNQYLFRLKNGDKVMSSRSYKDQVTRYLESV